MGQLTAQEEKFIRIKCKIKKLANATVTASNCIGHKKAERNKIIAQELTNELIEEGVKIPTVEELYKIGVFNGQGSV